MNRVETNSREARGQQGVSVEQWLRQHPDEAAALRRRIAAEQRENDRWVADDLRAAALRLREEIGVCKAGDENDCFTSARLPHSKFERALALVEQASQEFDQLAEGMSRNTTKRSRALRLISKAA